MPAGSAQHTASRDVLVVLPTLNEEGYIEACLRSLLGGAADRYTAVVCDGGSSDRTREIVGDLSTEFPQLSLLKNPKKLQSAAVNLAVSQVTSPDTKYIIRCDAHSIYPENFLDDIVSSLETTGAASVVTAMDSVGTTCFEKANAWAVDSLLGSGGAAHRGGSKSGYVDHGHHAGFDLGWFRKVGGYDESFSHNEDAEYDHRLSLAGGSIYLDADTRIEYTPRGDIQSLARQYFNYGKGRARTILKHAVRPKIRQLVPVAAVLGILFGVALLPLSPWFALLPVSYLVVAVTVSLTFALSKMSLCGLWTGFALATMHLSWGSGFLSQVLKHYSGRSERSVSNNIQKQR
ncbi:MAG: glycosyltransferase family 2 protein [Henriciella sp.]|nr:glycosyltransferase family 2 protein [Henriciella sp.]